MTDDQKPAETTSATQQEISAKVKSKAKRKGKSKITKSSKLTRSQSSISFPYLDLETAIGVARSMMNAGGVALSREQLAGVMNQAVGSGSFVLKTATSRTFGLIDYTGSKYELTDLGHAILDKDEKVQRAAKAQAFLTVPLYKRVYEEFRGRQLPPRPNGLEQAMVTFGVAAKQKSNARLAFDKSAGQAGFFSAGSERLIEPILTSSAKMDRSVAQDNDEHGQASQERRTAEPTGLHPFIQGLLGSLPEPGTNWTVEGRAKWLQAAANIFDLIYKGSGQIEIKAQNDKTAGE